MPGTVLVVEDEADLARLLTEVLQSVGYEVVLTTANRAAQRSADIRPALIVTDFMMPGQNGAEVISRIREAPGSPSVPVLLVTGLANAEEIARTMRADAYLRKPFDVDTFVEIVDRLAEPGD